jgi:hypothetical protein
MITTVNLITGEVTQREMTQEEIAALPVPDIGEIAQAKLAAINDGKNTALDGGFTHEGAYYDSDLKARTAYLELDTEIRVNPTYTTPWKASRGVWVAMDKTLYDALRVSYKAHISACFAWQAAREMEVAAAVALGSIEGVKSVEEQVYHG